MDKTKIAERLVDILPSGPLQTPGALNREDAIKRTAAELQQQQAAADIARVKRVEITRLRQMEAAKAKAEELGLDPTKAKGNTSHQVEALELQRQRVAAIEAIEEDNNKVLDVQAVAERAGSSRHKSEIVQQALALQGPSRADMARLLTSLNINLSVQLSKTDTANLLACLLTCNEAQLIALQANKKVPIVIKTVIKRLLEDMKLGNIDTVERIWDRVFGKGAMQLVAPDQSMTTMQGIIPNTPISREAYVVIRDTIIK